MSTRKLILEVSRWDNRNFEVVVAGSHYLDRDESHHFATKVAAVMFMEDMRTAGRSSKLYKIGNDND